MLRQYRNIRLWLIPGLRVKRWLIILILGITLVSLGLAYLLREFYASRSYPDFFFWLTLQPLSRPLRALVFGLAGASLIAWGMIELNRSLLAPFRNPSLDVAEEIYRHRRRQRGPHIVCIGGGTGMPSALRGLKAYTDHLTAIVTVADDGGSSGRLRSEMGLLPPGDFRNNIAALSEAEAITAQLFQYRFGTGTGLDGHAFGNLYLAAMAGVTGSFEQGLLESSRVLAVRGRVLPSTLELVQLVADVIDEHDGRMERIRGESLIPKVGAGRRIHRVYLDPDRPRAYPEAVRAILEADMIVAGPGSLYTSVIPNLLVPDIAKAVLASHAVKVFVCNIATQPGETDGYDVDDHIEAIFRHTKPGIFPYVLANDAFGESPPPGGFSTWVRPPAALPIGYRLVAADLRDPERPWRHDPSRMARALIDLLAEVTGVRASPF